MSFSKIRIVFYGVPANVLRIYKQVHVHNCGLRAATPFCVFALVHYPLLAFTRASRIFFRKREFFRKKIASRFSNRYVSPIAPPCSPKAEMTPRTKSTVDIFQLESTSAVGTTYFLFVTERDKVREVNSNRWLCRKKNIHTLWFVIMRLERCGGVSLVRWLRAEK